MCTLLEWCCGRCTQGSGPGQACATPRLCTPSAAWTSSLSSPMAHLPALRSASFTLNVAWHARTAWESWRQALAAETAVMDAAQCCCKCIAVQKQDVCTDDICGNIFQHLAAACSVLAVMTASSKQVDELCRNWGWHVCIQTQMSGPASVRSLQSWMNSLSWRLKTLWK